MNDVENRFYKLLNSYNDLEYGSHKGSKMSSFFAFLFLFVLGLFLDIFLIIEAIVENISVFYELVIIFLLPSIIPLIFYIFENKKSNKLLKELIDLRQNNKILANSKILLEDYFKDVISSEYTFDKEINKNKTILSYTKNEDKLIIIHTKIFGLNFIEAYHNGVLIKELCKKKPEYNGYSRSKNYTDALLLIIKYINVSILEK